MARTQSRSRRKESGGFYKSYRKKRKFELSGTPTLTKIDDKRARTTRVRGNNTKRKLFSTRVANVYDPKSKKYFKVNIDSVLENPANRNFVRRNILTKGTIIKTEKGKAKIVSRPGQEGNVNALLIE